MNIAEIIGDFEKISLEYFSKISLDYFVEKFKDKRHFFFACRFYNISEEFPNCIEMCRIVQCPICIQQPYIGSFVVE